MITEDYVSFESAKLLKEKGYWNIATMLYKENGDIVNYNVPLNNKGFSSTLDVFYEAPTLQMAMKWLRENFNINPVPYALSLGWAFDVFDLSNRDITGCKKLFSMDLPSKLECYNSYEEACEAGIKYCLENLI